MIAKEYQPSTQAIADLTALFARTGNDAVEKELRNVQAGDKAEKHVAWQLEQSVQSDRTLIVNGLRLESERCGVAQFDHIVVDQKCIVFVIETKHVSDGDTIKIHENGEFERYSLRRMRYSSMPSPLAQNDRHIEVLRKWFQYSTWVQPVFHSIVVFSTEAMIRRPFPGSFENVIKADLLPRYINNVLDASGPLHANDQFDECSFLACGRNLAVGHVPIRINYEGKFGLAGVGRVAPRSSPQLVYRESVAPFRVPVPKPYISIHTTSPSEDYVRPVRDTFARGIINIVYRFVRGLFRLVRKPGSIVVLALVAGGVLLSHWRSTHSLTAPMHASSPVAKKQAVKATGHLKPVR